MSPFSKDLIYRFDSKGAYCGFISILESGQVVKAYPAKIGIAFLNGFLSAYLLSQESPALPSPGFSFPFDVPFNNNFIPTRLRSPLCLSYIISGTTKGEIGPVVLKIELQQPV